jgi:hypothetical protein
VHQADQPALPGDYQVQIHVIEAREMKGEDYNGTSDPYVKMWVDGVANKRKFKKTSIKYKVQEAIWDETFFFNLKGLALDELEEAVINVAVFDWDLIGSDELIGAFTFDLLEVYHMPDHEYYRQVCCWHARMRVCVICERAICACACVCVCVCLWPWLCVSVFVCVCASGPALCLATPCSLTDLLARAMRDNSTRPAPARG